MSSETKARRVAILLSERHHLRGRGWSARLIHELLRVPDETRDHYRGVVRLWQEDRVIEAEKHPSFLRYQRERKIRSEALRKKWTDDDIRKIVCQMRDIDLTFKEEVEVVWD